MASKTRYKAVMFAPDGDWTTDYFQRDTIKEVEELLADQGSRWYFYPFHAVIVDKGGFTSETQHLMSVAYPFEHMKGQSIKAFSEMIANTPENELLAIVEG